jgi:hypothetical protein
MGKPRQSASIRPGTCGARMPAAQKTFGRPYILAWLSDRPLRNRGVKGDRRADLSVRSVGVPAESSAQRYPADQFGIR